MELKHKTIDKCGFSNDDYMFIIVKALRYKTKEAITAYSNVVKATRDDCSKFELNHRVTIFANVWSQYSKLCELHKRNSFLHKYGHAIDKNLIVIYADNGVIPFSIYNRTYSYKEHCYIEYGDL